MAAVFYTENSGNGAVPVNSPEPSAVVSNLVRRGLAVLDGNSGCPCAPGCEVMGSGVANNSGVVLEAGVMYG